MRQKISVPTEIRLTDECFAAVRKHLLSTAGVDRVEKDGNSIDVTFNSNMLDPVELFNTVKGIARKLCLLT